MPEEIQQLQQRVKLLENLLFVLIKSDKYYFSKLISLADGANIVMSSGTGTKFASSSDQKIGFWGITPIIRPSSTGEGSGFSAGGGTAVTHTSTFTGNTGSTAYTISDIIKHLKNIGLITT